MRVYTIKRIGKTYWANLYLDREITFSNHDKIYVGIMFFRKKDAVKYLNTIKFKECFEVVGMSVDKSEKDNRFTTK